MNISELRKAYLDFFRSKGHAIVPSSLLVPENDPTTLFTGSGMQPMMPYLLGAKHPKGKRIADSQKCFRAGDIEDIGDNRHTTFFEMLGNWSLGDYLKREQLPWIFEFLTKEVRLNPERIYVTVFRGSEEWNIPRDDESVKIWQGLFKEKGIEAKAVDFAERDGMQGGRIFYYDEKKNWWSRAGVPGIMPLGEPGGPDSEMFWDFGEELRLHEQSPFKDEACHVNCDCGRFLEIGNSVFMEYTKTEKGFEFLPQKNVDFGGGLERIAMAENNAPDIFLIDIFQPLVKIIEDLSGKKYSDEAKTAFRVIMDHLRAATFLIGDGVVPSNKDQGYFARRLIRRAIRFAHELGIKENFCAKIADVVIESYKEAYPDLLHSKESIFQEMHKEENKFRVTLERGLKLFEKIIIEQKELSGRFIFDLYTTYGFPRELITEEALSRGISITQSSWGEFEKLFKQHKELSRTASVGKFKGGLADASEQTTKLHTAAHLMLAALRKVLGEHVRQKGSNITAERLRFDFSHPEKMTPKQIMEVEKIVNEKIQENIAVKVEEMSLEEAKRKGAIGVFDAKYGDKVKVYTVESAQGGSLFSREICGGPHVERTGALGKFKITKEESSSAGVRRIKAVLE